MLETDRERVWKKDKERKEDRQRQRLKSSQKKNKSVCTLLCSWSISMTSDPRLESASCSNLSGALWGDSMCCGRETERWRNYIEKCLTHFGPGLGFWTAWLWCCRAKKKRMSNRRAGGKEERKKELNRKHTWQNSIYLNYVTVNWNWTETTAVHNFLSQFTRNMVSVNQV